MKTTTKYVLAYGLWLLAIGLLLTAYGLQAQSYEWQWAKHGGGSSAYYNEQGGDYWNDNFEHIIDIATDEDNNYYFLGTISHSNSHVDGNPVTTSTVGTSYSGENIIIASFTCNGVYRWSQTIRGGGEFFSFWVLDNNGGIIISLRGSGNGTERLCFSEEKDDGLLRSLPWGK